MLTSLPMEAKFVFGDESRKDMRDEKAKDQVSEFQDSHSSQKTHRDVLDDSAESQNTDVSGTHNSIPIDIFSSFSRNVSRSFGARFGSLFSFAIIAVTKTSLDA